MKHALLLCLLSLSLAAAPGAHSTPAYAPAKVDTLALLSLTPGTQYDCVELDLRTQTSTGRHLTLTVGMDCSNRYRLTLEQQVAFSFGSLGVIPLAVPDAYMVVSRTTSGWVLWECGSGWTAVDQRDNAAICPSGVPFPRLMAPDTEQHLSVSVRDGAAAALPSGGVDLELIKLSFGEAQGYLLSWTFSAGPSASLWSDGKGHLVGIESDWVLYRIVAPIGGV